MAKAQEASHSVQMDPELRVLRCECGEAVEATVKVYYTLGRRGFQIAGLGNDVEVYCGESHNLEAEAAIEVPEWMENGRVVCLSGEARGQLRAYRRSRRAGPEGVDGAAALALLDLLVAALAEF